MQRLCLVFEKWKRKKGRKNDLEKQFSKFKVHAGHLGNLFRCRVSF